MILLTGYSDLASIVGSINDSEVYRLIRKPWDNQELQQYLHSAIGRYAEYQSSPELLERHRVRETKAKDATFGQMLRERLKSLRLPFASRREP